MFITGTQAYGVTTEDSDIDVVMYTVEMQLLKEVLHRADINTYKSPIQIAQGYPGFYFDLMGGTINIIVVDDEKTYNQWQYATERMQGMTPIADREERIRIFKMFREDYESNNDKRI